MARHTVKITFEVDSGKRPTKAWLAELRRLLMLPTDEMVDLLRKSLQNNVLIALGWAAGNTSINLDLVATENSADDFPKSQDTFRVSLGK